MHTDNEFLLENKQNIMNSLINDGIVNKDINDEINNCTMYLINNTWEEYDKDLARFILEYSNILWENSDYDMLPLDDGVYDILRELYVLSGGIPPVGGIPITINRGLQSTDNNIQDYIIPAKFVNDIISNEDLLYTDLLLYHAPITRNDLMITPAIFANNIEKRTRNTAHQYPNLVGTLEKCKYVMKYQAEEKGVLNNPAVRVLERDFFGDHIKRGILSPDRIFSVLMMLKFDGLSVEGDMVYELFTSRGDAIGGVAADLTPIMRNYRFPNAPNVLSDEAFGIQFEAIMTYTNLYRYNQVKGYQYKNCRSAISGLFSSSDAWKYMDYVTLVPLASSLDLPKQVQLEFMNRYYTKGIYNSYTIITGNVTTILYQIKKFAEEAEMMRDYIDFQYDGIVIEYIDEDLKQALGRENAVNKYAQAIKFNPLKKQTIFKGYTFTVGQDGYITPMIHYEPVEFMGTIHPKSSGHSLDRFNELQLRMNDMLDVEYVNDVMPYVTKPDNSYNTDNMNLNPIIEFPTQCPVCGSELVISKSGASAYCMNINCEGRRLARIVNMLDKLGIEHFADANVEKIGVYTFKGLMTIERSILAYALGSDIMADKFINQRDTLINSNIWDYRILGAIGFDAMAEETWKLILNNITLYDVCYMEDELLYNRLINIRGIGSVKARTVIERRPFFKEDMVYILENFHNIKSYFGYSFTGKKIRFSGFRDNDFVSYVTSLGCDISDKSVTRDTELLIVANDDDIINNPTSKVKAAQKYGIPIVTLNYFKDNIDSIL